MTDIAAQAKVSEATVSRVLNGRPGVSEAKREAVLAALDVLGHERPDRSRRPARGLVGLVVPELDNPVFPLFAQAVERALTRRGHTPLLCTRFGGGSAEDELVDQLLERGARGLVFVSGLHADTQADLDRYRRLLSRGVALAMINGTRPELAGSFVATDDRQAARLAVNHLVSLGHRTLGLALGPARYLPSALKAEGFAESVAALLGPGASAHVEHSLYSVEGGQAAGSRLLDLGCTGIVCGSDLMALGVVRAARARGLRVPEDVSVIGYDDSPLMGFTDPPLTTVRQPVADMAAAAVSMLLESMDRPAPRHGELAFHPELVVRGSTASRA
ncbi:LacI family DNA-binding transcriptional regulator [Actinocorallia libanotica]|uniref:LacI family DNA-binding transcriptional regulator n=1 Tax=Actinocorallia libanotica TaxID=46162 RepID=A0ABP4B1D4_9ACTN